ncbi:helix-turn-helix transcriptional regulator [Phytohabitans sp. ZYX-F-186]|uniref:Helix-turn-helix transcriptional regulator n=1 Tax=Phytohabitans maris TaxID=3071409 RepID=A0ABU0ZCN7_9ACTN|nr:helix-turn-helix transcriptional regulator [Phytohabitans sp. ZYX-F-186]MDQ7904830.1 helix-turn-helix transcriptional regulator [Phytohabitans sp. ZYX-F-186]
MTVTADTATVTRHGWAARDDRPEHFPGVAHVWKRRRLSAGLKQATVIRRMTELATRQGVSIAAPTSLKTMLSKWENGAKMSPLYEELLCLVYGVRRAEHVNHRPARYRNSAIYDRLLPTRTGVGAVRLTQPGLR